MDDVDLYGEVKSDEDQDNDAGEDVDLYGDLAGGDDTSKQKYGGESPGKEAEAMHDSTPSPISELLSTKQLTASSSLTPDKSGGTEVPAPLADSAPVPPPVGSSADANAPPPKSPEANLDAPKGFLLKFNNTPDAAKKCVYIGNLPWWCTDLQLAHACINLGAKDLKGIRFYENRLNGQSKGYALVEFGSEVSCHIVANKLPSHIILSQHPTAALTSKIGLTQFEQLMKKGQSAILEEVNKSSYTGRPRVQTKQEDKPKAPSFPPSGGPPGGGGPPIQMGGPFPPMGPGPGMPGPWMGPGPGMPPPMPDMMHPRPMHPPIPPFPGPPDMMMAHRGPVPHVNPNFFPEPRLPRPSEPFGGHGPSGAEKQPFSSHIDFAEVMKRNHAVSSTALVRAVQDANTGDYESAVSTLNTAISLISQSAAASSESSQALIQNLKDCLQGIEAQAQKGKSGSPVVMLSPPGQDSSNGSRSPSPSFRRDRSRSRGRRDDRDHRSRGRDKGVRRHGGRERQREREPPPPRDRYSRSRKDDDYRRSRRK